MKNKPFLIAILVLFIVSCGQRTNKDSNVHTHEDGSVHADHPEGHIKPDQEEFEIKADTLHYENDLRDAPEQNHDHYHMHDDGKPHKH